MNINRVILGLAIAMGCSGTAMAQIGNTWYGTNALNVNTSGSDNSAFGNSALYTDTSGSFNTASGYYALFANTTGSNNNASGYQALGFNTTGIDNNAMGSAALASNTTGSYNNAVGYFALYNNTTGLQNNASGYVSLYQNTTGNYNTGYGAFSINANTSGIGNNGTGYGALYRNTTGGYNSADGYFALGYNTTGANNIAVGPYAGYNLTTGSNNIDIGSRGVAAETAVIRIGTQNTQQAAFLAGVSGVNVTFGATVKVNSSGQLGVVLSSRRYKEDIRSMGNASHRLLALRPVTFRYKKADENGQKPKQYGLIAEEVAQVMPELVVYNEKGQPETVAYETLTPLLLNELQREHDQVLSLTRHLESQDKVLHSMTKQLAELESLRSELTEFRRTAGKHPTSSEN